MIEMRTLEQIEEHYNVVLDNDILLRYHGGQWSSIYSLTSRWHSNIYIENSDQHIKGAVEELDQYLKNHPDDNEALAWRALLASMWNQQFKGEASWDTTVDFIEQR